MRAAVTGTRVDDEPDWQRGLTYAPESTGGYRALSGCTAQSIDHVREQAPVVDYMPWELQVEDPCHTTFGYNRDEVTNRLRRAFDTIESYGIAHELWTGELAQADTAEDPDGDMVNNLYLAKGPEILSAAPVSPKRGLGLLEGALGDALYGQQAFIHVSRTARPFFPELVKQGNLLLTNIDNMIVADAGYPGTPPEGTAAVDGVAWVYGTAPVVVRRSPVFGDGPENETTDTRTNTITRRASKVVAATFDPTALFAVPITLA